MYTDWPKAQEAIIGWKGPKYKKFDTRAEAEAFVRSHGTGATVTGMLEPDSDEAEAPQEPPAKKAKRNTKAALSRGNVVVVYTDGSSLGNGRLGAAAGVGVYFGESDARFVAQPDRRPQKLLTSLPSRNISERLSGEVQTNQRAELTAILRALETIDITQDLEIRSDSKYSIQCVTEWYVNWERNGWKTRGGPVKNQDLVQAIRAKLEERESSGGQTQFIWVKGHDTDQGNIAADLLAVEGARK